MEKLILLSIYFEKRIRFFWSIVLRLLVKKELKTDV